MSNDSGWKEVYSVGEEIIDSQHKELFALCQAIDDLASSGQSLSMEEATKQLSQLSEEFRNHFEQEMHIFASVYHIAYMDHEQHHIDFIDKLWDILDEAKEKNRVPDLHEVISFIRKWFIRHILETDMPQFKELQERGAVNKINTEVLPRRARGKDE